MKLIKSLIVFIVLGGILAYVVLKTPDNGSNKSPNQASQSSAAAPDGSPIYPIGDTIKTDKFEITVQSVRTLTSIPDSLGGDPNRPADGGVYVAVRWKYKNISNKPIGSFSTPSIELVDKAGTTYDTDVGASSDYAAEVGDTEKLVSDVNPGISINSSDVFEVSKSLYDPSTWRLLVDADDNVYFALTQPPPKTAAIASQSAQNAAPAVAPTSAAMPIATPSSPASNPMNAAAQPMQAASQVASSQNTASSKSTTLPLTITRQSGESDKDFVTRATQQTLVDGQPIVNTQQVIPGLSGLLAFTDSGDDNIMLNVFINQGNENYLRLKSVTACDRFMGPTTLESFFFFKLDPSSSTKDIGVICNWGAQHNVDCALPDDVRFFHLTEKSVTEIPMDRFHSVLYKKNKQGCSEARFNNAYDVKRLLGKYMQKTAQ